MVSTRLRAEQTSVLWNKEVSLIWRSSTHFYGRPFGTLFNRLHNGDVRNSEGRNREVLLHIATMFFIIFMAYHSHSVSAPTGLTIIFIPGFHRSERLT